MHNERGIQRGKDFEEVIKRAFLDVDNTVVERLPDPTQGYLGVRNKCDFLVYHYPNIYYIECKTTHNRRLPFANITFNQRVGMLNASMNYGVIAGVICWFVNDDRTIFIPIHVIENKRLNGEKSINLNKELDAGCFELKGIKKRVFFEYDMDDFFKKCTRRKLGGQ